MIKSVGPVLVGCSVQGAAASRRCINALKCDEDFVSAKAEAWHFESRDSDELMRWLLVFLVKFLRRKFKVIDQKVEGEAAHTRNALFVAGLMLREGRGQGRTRLNVSIIL